MDRKSQVYEWVTAVCVALLILIVAVHVYSRWANTQVDPPANCSEYTGDSKTKCTGMMDWCATLTGQDQEACYGAVGACMPAADAAGQYAATVNVATPVGRFNAMAPHLERCVLAAQKVSPAGVAALINTNGDGKISAEDEHNNWEALFLANMWLAQAEMIEQHEHSFQAWSDAKRKGRERVHRKRYQIFDKHTTVDTLEQVTDANRDGYWSELELGDALDFIHKNHHAMGRSVLQHYRHIFGILDKDRSGGLTRDEVVKTKYVDNIEHFIEQEALRAVLHELEERKGFGLDFHRYRHMEAGGSGEL